ncbi:MAG: ribosome recycling factor [Acidobacteriia bacterium]|nr:ribosome recycling factor [Terriglobia bacterium]
MTREIVSQSQARMEKAVEDFKHHLSSVRTGRANVGLIDHIKVDYYGTLMPLNQVASLAVPDPTSITVQAWDISQLAGIEKAIRSSDLGLNPTNDGKVIRVPIPPLNEERRKELVKHLHKVLEDHRTAVRNIRRDENDRLKKALKDKKISEDDEKKALDEIQKMTNQHIEKLDGLAKGKEKEIMEV